MKEVKYKFVTGFPGNAYSSVVRRVSQYERHCYHMKIGITGRDPQYRFEEHLRGNSSLPANYWDRMVVVYQTRSIRHANTMEKLLIDYYKERLNCKIDQKCGGGSYHLMPVGYNYVYLLLKY